MNSRERLYFLTSGLCDLKVDFEPDLKVDFDRFDNETSPRMAEGVGRNWVTRAMYVVEELRHRDAKHRRLDSGDLFIPTRIEYGAVGNWAKKVHRCGTE